MKGSPLSSIVIAGAGMGVVSIPARINSARLHVRLVSAMSAVRHGISGVNRPLQNNHDAAVRLAVVRTARRAVIGLGLDVAEAEAKPLAAVAEAEALARCLLRQKADPDNREKNQCQQHLSHRTLLL
jgi:hypothetical protein